MSELKIPSREECYEILKEFEVPDNIIRHIELVNKIAVFLANKLKQAGVDVNVELVDRASLLHDLDKMQTLEEGNHGEVTEEILVKKGFPKLGKIALQHRFMEIHNPNLNWEAKVVNYADKRTMHDKLVSLKTRLDDLWARYNSEYPQRDKVGDELFFKLEKEIFSLIGLDPDDLERFVQ